MLAMKFALVLILALTVMVDNISSGTHNPRRLYCEGRECIKWESRPSFLCWSTGDGLHNTLLRISQLCNVTPFTQLVLVSLAMDHGTVYAIHSADAAQPKYASE
ncbi:hypothetical protein MTO96_022468 [Rhipicephalus appendiculatus]